MPIEKLFWRILNVMMLFGKSLFNFLKEFHLTFWEDPTKPYGLQ